MSLRIGLSTPMFAACAAAFAAVAAAPQHVLAADAAYRVVGRQVLDGPVRPPTIPNSSGPMPRTAKGP
jgi:hypothetical protein